MRVFVLYWYNGETEVIKGEGKTFDDVFGQKYGGGVALMALDAWKEASPTQGGGYVILDEVQQKYVFVADPPEGYSIGDLMPKAWGLAPVLNEQPIKGRLICMQ